MSQSFFKGRLGLAAALAMGMSAPAFGGAVEVARRDSGYSPAPVAIKQQRSRWNAPVAPKRASAKAKRRAKMRKESQRANRRKK